MLISMLERHRVSVLIGLAALAGLTVVYLSTLQTIINGSDHYFMIDVGETQIVLNVWGTLHATGYPHYVMSGALLVTLLRALGVDPATAPGVVSLIWGLLALGLIYALAARLTNRPLLAGLMVVVYGLTRTIWIHHVIAEIYTLTLVFLSGLLLIALWPGPVRGRLYWLALIGGAGVAHHRSIAMAIPALVYAAWSQLTQPLRAVPRRLIVCGLLGVLGFIPYLYLMLRAQAGAAWVYGEPETLAGLWDQFIGREAERFIGAPETAAGILANAALINEVLVTDVGLVGIALGVAGLAAGLRVPHLRRAAIAFSLSGGTAYLFHIFLYTDVLSALILAITLSLAFGWLFAADRLLAWLERHSVRALSLGRAATGFAALAAVFALNAHNRPFIEALTTDPTGLETIALARTAPPGSTLMLAWGPRHFAVGFARDVLGELPGLRLVDHKADYAALLDDGPLVTPWYTFYNQPLSWWEARLGGPVYLNAAAPELVEIAREPVLLQAAPPVGPAWAAPNAVQLSCSDERLILTIDWAAPRTPPRDLNVFVHLIDADGTLLAQDDRAAPVYGWRPLTSWLPNERVRDSYALPRLADAEQIRFGLYAIAEDGTFDNLLIETLPAVCTGGDEHAHGSTTEPR